MSKFANKQFFGSLMHALRGVAVCIRTERNFKYQILILFIICSVGYFVKYSAVEYALAIFSIMLVLIVEMINSCVEYALDSVYKNKYSILVKLSKDISAGAVFLASANCVIVNAVILLSKFLKIFS